jgi:hypothetical protein
LVFFGRGGGWHRTLLKWLKGVFPPCHTENSMPGVIACRRSPRHSHLCTYIFLRMI